MLGVRDQGWIRRKEFLENGPRLVTRQQVEATLLHAESSCF
jgi:hypothetical protein